MTAAKKKATRDAVLTFARKAMKRKSEQLLHRLILLVDVQDQLELVDDDIGAKGEFFALAMNGADIGSKISDAAIDFARSMR